MSLFKRKHSKADIHPPPSNMAGVVASPPAPTAPVAANGTQQRGYGSVGTGPGGQQARRMTSNPQLNAAQATSQSLPSQNEMGQMGIPQPGYHLSQRQSSASPVVGMPAGGNGSPHMNMHSAPHSYPSQTHGSPGQAPVSSALINTTSYPWMVRPLRLPPTPSPVSGILPSPFPRYGLSVTPFPSQSGHMLLFGGLVADRVRNDLWSIDIRDLSTMWVKTKGEAPIPRVGHASVICDKIIIIWGGDTKINAEDVQDEALYVLDLRSQDWVKIPVARGPIGRYGHAACMVEDKFYVFGGQADGAFMNDMWTYDITQLTEPNTQHKWEQVPYRNPPPPCRTGHVLVAGPNSQLYLFGGTDGNYHYNDTWTFDPTTGEWSELSCIGYIPLPREGHAAAIVDDTIYIFGGRDVKGKDLGDLVAFKLSNQRWYMFQNMGPAPSARSGHAMVSAHGKIFVVGGEANQALSDAHDDPSMIHILDTSKIKYPIDGPKKPFQVQKASQQGQPGTPAKVPQSSSAEGLHSMRAMSPNTEREKASTNQPLGTMMPSNLSPGQEVSHPPVHNVLSDNPITSHPIVAQTQSHQPPVQSPTSPPASRPIHSVKPNGPPQRPRREDDEEYANSHPASPYSPAQNNFPRVTSPTSPQQSSILSATSPISPKNHHRIRNPSLNGTRSPSPRLRNADGSGGERERAPPPPDAFYYGRRSPTSNGYVSHGTSRPSSLGPSNDIIRDLRAKDQELEEGRKRENALKVILARAVRQGFVAGDDNTALFNEKDKNEDLDGKNDGDTKASEVVDKLTDALVRLKREKAEMQSDFAAQIRQASDRSLEADQLRRGALQETAFYRAKIAALESNSIVDLKRLEKDRIIELEKQIGTLSGENDAMERELEKEKGHGVLLQDLQNAATERESETLKRAEDAEEARREAEEELETLRSKISEDEITIREHSEQLITLSSAAQQHQSELSYLQSQLNEAIQARDQNLELVSEAQAAITAAGLMASEMEALYTKESTRTQQLEEELVECKAELEARNRNVELADERLQEIENAYAKSREEADALRAVTTSRLGEVLDNHKELLANNTRHTRDHEDKVRTLEEEGKSLRKMLKEAGQRVDAAESGATCHRQKTKDLETKVQTLRGELRESRTKLLNVQSELARHRDLHSSRDDELKDKELTVTEVETRCTMLRNLLADHGIAVNNADLENMEMPSSRELETQLRDRTRANEAAQREIESLQTRCEEAEDKVESLGRLVERIKDARSPTMAAMRSPTPTGAAEGGRVGELEKKLVDMEKVHRDKIAGLEGDYQTAVRYVKGTEKMMKRMKDELHKQKTSNVTLQSELDQFRGRSSVSGRSTPSTSSADVDLQRRFNTLQNQHQKLQEDLNASQDVLSARNREVDLLRLRLGEAERELDALREDLAQAQHRIETLLDVRGVSDDDGSEEASMAYDKLTKELKQWERSRSPGGSGTQEQDSSDEDGTIHLSGQPKGSQTHASEHNPLVNHKRSSSEYRGDWPQ
nr:hypothetical protein L204_02367 [Cryptococcus depauperatus CBS 7855]